MKTLLFISFLTTFYVFAQRDPRPKDQANVFWNGAYSLYSLSSDEEIKPNSSGKYEFWGTTNENPQPIQYSLMKGNTLYVYKFISYSECLNSCNEIRKSKGLALLQTNQVSVEQINNTKPTINLKSVVIGTQTWTTENLNVSTFRNGDPIPEAKTKEEWKKAGKNKQPAWCYFENDPSNGTKYGKLYNWHAINDPRGLAPEGWHVSTKSECEDLGTYLSGINSPGHVGEKMKMYEIITISYEEIGGYYKSEWIPCKNCSYWTEQQRLNNPCTVCKNEKGKYVKTDKYIPKTKKSIEVNMGWNGTNESGFSALHGGERDCFSGDWEFGDQGYWWTGSETEISYESKTVSSSAYCFRLSESSDDYGVNSDDKSTGKSVRLIKD